MIFFLLGLLVAGDSVCVAPTVCVHCGWRNGFRDRSQLCFSSTCHRHTLVAISTKRQMPISACPCKRKCFIYSKPRFCPAPPQLIFTAYKWDTLYLRIFDVFFFYFSCLFCFALGCAWPLLGCLSFFIRVFNSELTLKFKHSFRAAIQRAIID